MNCCLVNKPGKRPSEFVLLLEKINGEQVTVRQQNQREQVTVRQRNQRGTSYRLTMHSFVRRVLMPDGFLAKDISTS